MLKSIALALTVAGLAGLVSAAPVDAASGKAKVKKSQTAQSSLRRSAMAQRNGPSEPFPGQLGFRDRTTINHPNGRLNGQELFDSINERGNDSGP